MMGAMRVTHHDVIVIGGGGAGLRAAIAVAQTDPTLSIGLVSKVYPMRSHTVAAEGGMAAVIKDDDSLEDHIYDTISGSDWLADQDAVELFVNEAPRELVQLEHWGCPWSREPSGEVAVRPFGGMRIERTWYAADKTGFHILHALFQTSMKYEQIVRYDEWFALRLLVSDGRCHGCVAIELRTGQVHALSAGAVILCTGGAGRVFPFTTNGSIKTGDGMSLAYRAGVALKDLEFVQYHPTGLPGTGILMTEASRGEGGILVNNKNRRYLQDYDLGQPLPIDHPDHPVKRSMELGPRDRLSQAFVHEQEQGNTFEDAYGHHVLLDVRHLGAQRINTKLPFVRELALDYAGIDPVDDPIPVRPVVHYMMGGVDTDLNGATELPGLYAVGECACVSINGANRLGSNSLTELVVFGARAGRAAASFSKRARSTGSPALEPQVDEERGRVIELLSRRNGGERIAALRNTMTAAMEAGCGIYRTRAGLEETRDTISELRERFGQVTLDDHTNVYNTELISALELDAMLDVSEALVACALARQESRGSHQRKDFPQRDDGEFLRHSLAFHTDEGPRVSYKDVVITRWPPGERSYGGAAKPAAAPDAGVSERGS